MGKFGVGIGDEFPVDEGKPDDKPQPGQQGRAPEEPRGEDGPRNEDGDCRHWRGRRYGWHRWRDYAHGHDGSSDHGHSRYWHTPHAPHLLQALLIIGGIAMLIAIISHFFYFILGAAVLAVLAITYRNHHDAMWDMHPRRPSSEAR